MDIPVGIGHLPLSESMIVVGRKWPDIDRISWPCAFAQIPMKRVEIAERERRGVAGTTQMPMEYRDEADRIQVPPDSFEAVSGEDRACASR